MFKFSKHFFFQISFEALWGVVPGTAKTGLSLFRWPGLTGTAPCLTVKCIIGSEWGHFTLERALAQVPLTLNCQVKYQNVTMTTSSFISHDWLLCFHKMTIFWIKNHQCNDKINTNVNTNTGQQTFCAGLIDLNHVDSWFKWLFKSIDFLK